MTLHFILVSFERLLLIETLQNVHCNHKQFNFVCLLNSKLWIKLIGHICIIAFMAVNLIRHTKPVLYMHLLCTYYDDDDDDKSKKKKK